MKEIIEKTKYLLREYEKTKSIDILTNIEKLFTNYFKKYPFEIPLRLKYALLVFESPFIDSYEAFNCLKSILKFEPNNIQALLLLALLQYIEFGSLKTVVYKKLSEINNDSQEIMSMVKYIQALNYSVLGEEKIYEEFLLESIKYYQKHLWNYVSLGILYINQGKIAFGKKLIETGLKNLNHIYNKYDLNSDELDDPEEFFNEQLKGINLTQPVFNWIVSYLD